MAWQVAWKRFSTRHPRANRTNCQFNKIFMRSFSFEKPFAICFAVFTRGTGTFCLFTVRREVAILNIKSKYRCLLRTPWDNNLFLSLSFQKWTVISYLIAKRRQLRCWLLGDLWSANSLLYLGILCPKSQLAQRVLTWTRGIGTGEK
jgi:hypothetical protein